LYERWGGSAESGAEPSWGDYVRRDALGARPEAVLQRLRRVHAAAGLTRTSF
jgi:hypothetical protein